MAKVMGYHSHDVLLHYISFFLLEKKLSFLLTLKKSIKAAMLGETHGEKLRGASRS